MNRCMNRFIDGGWIDRQKSRWLSMDRRVASVSLRPQVCWEIPKDSNTASAHALSRLAPGHAPLWEHLQESALHGSSCYLWSRKLPTLHT